MLCKGSINIHR